MKDRKTEKKREKKRKESWLQDHGCTVAYADDFVIERKASQALADLIVFSLK